MFSAMRRRPGAGSGTSTAEPRGPRPTLGADDAAVVGVGVVLAAGRSHRLSDVTNGGSKLTLPIGGASLAERAVRALQSAGVGRVIVAVGFEADSVAECLEGYDVEIVRAEAWADGNGASLAAAEHLIRPDERFALVCGDHVFADGALDDLLRSTDPAVLVDFSPDPAVWAEGTRVRIAGGQATAFGKSLDDPAVDCGAFVLPAAVFDAGREAASRGDHSLSGALGVLVRETGLRAVPLRPGEWWQDVDTLGDLITARRLLRRSLAKESDGTISRKLNRPMSTRITMALAPLRLSPSLVSAVTFGIGVWAAWLLSAGRAIEGGLLTQTASILDGCDGETARLHGTASRRGAALDGFLDRMVDGAIFAGMVLWAWGDRSRDIRTLVLAVSMLGFGILASSLKGPVTVFETSRRDEPRLVVLLGGRDARMLILAIGSVAGMPVLALTAALATYGLGVIWRVAFVVGGRRHWGREPVSVSAGAGSVTMGADALGLRTTGTVGDSGTSPVRPKARAATAAAAVGRAARALLFPAVVIGAFAVVLPRVADLHRVWELINALSWEARLVLVAITVWNLVSYWPVVMLSMPGLSFRQAAVVCQSSTTVAMTVPAGGAVAVGVSYAMFSSWGFGSAAIASSTLGTWVVGMSVKLLLPAFALVALGVEGERVTGAVSAALTGALVLGAGVLVLAVLLRREGATRRIGRTIGSVVNRVRRWQGHPPVAGLDDRAVGFRSQLRGLLRDRWATLSVASVVSQLSVFLVMLVTMHLVGISENEVSWAEALAVFASVRLATSVPIVPGNVGFAELGYIGGLLLVQGNPTEVVAAVLLFRLLTYFIQIPIGAVTFLSWRLERAQRSAIPIVRKGEDSESPENGRPMRRGSPMLGRDEVPLTDPR